MLQTTTEQKRYQTESRAHVEAVFKAASTPGRRNMLYLDATPQGAHDLAEQG